MVCASACPTRGGPTMITERAVDAEARRRWHETKLARAQQREAAFTTVSGEPIAPLYTHEDLAGTDPLADIGFPGEFPYTRGIHATMYRGRLWTMRQFAGF